MKRSEINATHRAASACFAAHHWALPPAPKWDITDFGLGDFSTHGLTLVNLAEEPEYCEKLMYARRGQTTPCHTHAKNKAYPRPLAHPPRLARQPARWLDCPRQRHPHALGPG